MWALPTLARVSTIRDVVDALVQREGVNTVIVLGRDGLPIVSVARNGVDADGLAALVPSLVNACTELGHAAACGDFTTGVVEYGAGLAIICVVTPETLLALLVDPNTNIGPLLYELHQHRPNIAGLL
jgi:predicted regulator of Ras-like GTPase activity (Roadblock/LC7/MglB family)